MWKPCSSHSLSSLLIFIPTRHSTFHSLVSNVILFWATQTLSLHYECSHVKVLSHYESVIVLSCVAWLTAKISPPNRTNLVFLLMCLHSLRHHWSHTRTTVWHLAENVAKWNIYKMVTTEAEHIMFYCFKCTVKVTTLSGAMTEMSVWTWKWL